jgi:hypothetical protein
MESVYCVVRAEYLNAVHIIFSFYMVSSYTIIHSNTVARLNNMHRYPAMYWFCIGRAVCGMMQFKLSLLQNTNYN